MVVTHLFHVLGFVAMEPPTALDGRSIIEESGKVFRSIAADRSEQRDPRPVRGLPGSDGVDPDSQTETFIAHEDRDRQLALVGRPVLPAHRQVHWASPARLLTIAFREPPRKMFSEAQAFVEDYGPDHISFDFGDPGGITTSFLAKVPGPRMRLGQAQMKFSYEGSFNSAGLEAYERLLYDAMLGDRHAVHGLRGHRETCGRRPPRCWRTRRRCIATRRGAMARRRCTS